MMSPPSILAGRRKALAALLAAPWALRAGAAPADPALGKPLRLADVPLLEGGAFRAAEAEGKVVVVYWWASWCPFCAEMSPHIEKLWRGQQARGLTVLGISIDTKAEAALDYRRRKGYTFPSALNGPAVEKVIPKPKGLPVTWVRDRGGRVAMAEAGQLFPEDIEQIARFL
jgi:thiol-disulfide isomerase/thioredoxin